MSKLTRRMVLRACAVSGTGLVCEASWLGSLLRSTTGLAEAQEAVPLFMDGFDIADVASKPDYTIIRDVKDGFRWLHTPSIIEGRHGVLLATWSSNGPHGDEDPTNIIEVCRSLDNGVTWGPPIIAVPPSACNPVFLRAKNGDTILFFDLNQSLRQDDCSIAFRRTHDNGLTWGETQKIDVGARVTIIVNNGLTLPNGDWLISFHYDRSSLQGEFVVDNADYVACVAVSSDEGRTWKRYDAAEIPNESHRPNAKSWAVEPAVFLIKNGMLRMVIRSRSGSLYETTSLDMGKTWTPVTKMAFSNDDSKPSVLALKDGNAILLWNDAKLLDFDGRFPLMATLSTDEGETWFRSVTLEDSNVALDYPTAVQTGDSIKLVYGWDRKQMRFINLHESDFKTWTPINNAGSWIVKDGVMQFAGGRGGGTEANADWLRWSKVVAFLPKRSAATTMALEFRIDEEWPKDAMIGMFPAYQDESNWTAWVWQLAGQKAGFQVEAHRGSMTRPYYANNLSDTYFDPVSAPQPGTWYRIEVTLKPGVMEHRLTNKATGKVLLTSRNEFDWQGQFIALGSRKVAVSFDNVVVRSS
jgi:predicted neuraminidase